MERGRELEEIVLQRVEQKFKRKLKKCGLFCVINILILELHLTQLMKNLVLKLNAQHLKKVLRHTMILITMIKYQ